MTRRGFALEPSRLHISLAPEASESGDGSCISSPWCKGLVEALIRIVRVRLLFVGTKRFMQVSWDGAMRPGFNETINQQRVWPYRYMLCLLTGRSASGLWNVQKRQ